MACCCKSKGSSPIKKGKNSIPELGVLTSSGRVKTPGDITDLIGSVHQGEVVSWAHRNKDDPGQHERNNKKAPPEAGDGSGLWIRYLNQWILVPLPWYEKNLSAEDKEEYKDFDFSKGSDCSQYLLDKVGVTNIDMHKHGYYLKQGKREKFYEDDLPFIFGARRKKDLQQAVRERINEIERQKSEAEKNKYKSSRGGGGSSSFGGGSFVQRGGSKDRSSSKDRGGDRWASASKEISVPFTMSQVASFQKYSGSGPKSPKRGHSDANNSPTASPHDNFLASAASPRAPPGSKKHCGHAKAIGGLLQKYGVDPSTLDPSTYDPANIALDPGNIVLREQSAGSDNSNLGLEDSDDEDSDDEDASPNSSNPMSPNKSPNKSKKNFQKQPPLIPLLSPLVKRKIRKKNKVYELIPARETDYVSENIHRLKDRRLRVFVPGAKHFEIDEGKFLLKQGFRVFWVNNIFSKPRLRYMMLSEDEHYLYVYLAPDAEDDDSDADAEDKNHDDVNAKDSGGGGSGGKFWVTLSGNESTDTGHTTMNNTGHTTLSSTAATGASATGASTKTQDTTRETFEAVVGTISEVVNVVGNVLSVGAGVLSFGGAVANRMVPSWSQFGRAGMICKSATNAVGIGNPNSLDDLEPVEIIDLNSISVNIFPGQQTESWQERFLSGVDIGIYQQVDSLSFSIQYYDEFSAIEKTLDCVARNEREYDIILGTIKALVFEKKEQKLSKQTLWDHSRRFREATEDSVNGNRSEFWDLIHAPILFEEELQLPDVLFAPLVEIMEKAMSTIEDIKRRNIEEKEEKERRRKERETAQKGGGSKQHNLSTFQLMIQTSGISDNNTSSPRSSVNSPSPSKNSKSPRRSLKNAKEIDSFVAGEFAIQRVKSKDLAGNRQDFQRANQNKMLPIESGMQFQLHAYIRGLAKVAEKSKKAFRGVQDFEREGICRTLAIRNCHKNLEIVKRERELLMKEPLIISIESDPAMTLSGSGGKKPGATPKLLNPKEIKKGTPSPTKNQNTLHNSSPTKNALTVSATTTNFGSRMKLALGLFRAASELENIKIFYGRARLNLRMKPDDLMRVDIGHIAPFLEGRHKKGFRILGFEIGGHGHHEHDEYGNPIVKKRSQCVETPLLCSNAGQNSDSQNMSEFFANPLGVCRA